MWKSFFDFAKQVLRLTDEMQSAKSSIKQLEKRNEELSELLNRLIYRIGQLEEKHAHNQEISLLKIDRLEERYARDQEMLLLKLENRILREVKGLLPANPSDDRND